LKSKQNEGRKPPRQKILPEAERPLFADMASAQFSMERGILQFGMIDPASGEQKIHTQIVMHPHGIVRLSKMLTEGIQKAREQEKLAKGPIPPGGEPN
jgi:hypothetical protein